MSVYELNREQLIELKQNYICEQNELKGEPTYWSDMAEADDLVTDEEIYENYGGYSFTADDFAA